MQSLEQNNRENTYRQWSGRRYPRAIPLTCPNCQGQLCDTNGILEKRFVDDLEQGREPVYTTPVHCTACGFKGMRVL